MSRFLPLSFLFAASALTGCTLCDNPYDYCGPVVSGGYSEQYVDGAIAEELVPTEAAPPVMPATPTTSAKKTPTTRTHMR